jgi:hypothetical protein
MLNLSPDDLLSTLCLSWTAPVCLVSRITLLDRRRCRNGQRRRLTNLRPTTSGSAGSRPVPLEAGVVVLVPVLVGRTRMQLCHRARPLSSLHPGLRGGVGITEPTYTSIGTRVLPRAQGCKKCPVRSPSQYVGPPTGAYMRHNPRRPRGQPGEQGLPPLSDRATATAEPGLCQALSSSMKMTQMIKALLTFGDLPRQARLHRRPSGHLRH